MITKMKNGRDFTIQGSKGFGKEHPSQSNTPPPQKDHHLSPSLRVTWAADIVKIE